MTWLGFWGSLPLRSVKGASFGFSWDSSHSNSLPSSPEEAEAKGSSPRRGPMVQGLLYSNVVVLNTF